MSITERRMPLGGAEVDEAPIGQQEEAPPVGHQVFAGERPHLAGRGRLRLERSELELVVEVAGVGEDRAVAHLGKSVAPHTFRFPVAAMKISPTSAATAAVVTR